MIGNKIEEEEKNKVDYTKVKEWADINKIDRVFEVSAKTGQNIE